jgi:hypothetical protein
MPCYDNSIHALQHLLQSGGHNDKECHIKNTKTVNCQITRTSQHVYHLRNGIEYCFVEVTCDDCTQYGLQAYGEEAMKLYNEVYKCIMCGRPPREPKRSVVVEETIDGKSYIFDSNGCALIFRKLNDIIGKEAFQ